MKKKKRKKKGNKQIENIWYGSWGGRGRLKQEGENIMIIFNATNMMECVQAGPQSPRWAGAERQRGGRGGAHLWDKEEDHGLAEVAQDPDHSKCHACTWKRREGAQAQGCAILPPEVKKIR